MRAYLTEQKQGEISELVDREIIVGLIEEYDIQLSDPALGRPRKDEIRDKTQDSVRFFADACAFDSCFCAEGK